MPKKTGEIYRNTILCVDSYDCKEMKGRFYHRGLGDDQGQSFDSLAQFLIGVETLFNEMQFPQAYEGLRTFSMVPGSALDNASLATPTGKLATFKIHIMFRQHASWQGSVLWFEGADEQPFRSVLELVTLLDSALRTREEASA